MLGRLYQDWARAPISGTAALLAFGMAAVAFGRNDVTNGLLFVIIGQLWTMQRDPMPEDE